MIKTLRKHAWCGRLCGRPRCRLREDDRLRELPHSRYCITTCHLTYISCLIITASFVQLWFPYKDGFVGTHIHTRSCYNVQYREYFGWCPEIARVQFYQCHYLFFFEQEVFLLLEKAYNVCYREKKTAKKKQLKRFVRSIPPIPSTALLNPPHQLLLGAFHQCHYLIPADMFWISFFCLLISSAVLRAALATSDEDWNQVQVLDNLKAVTRGFRGNNCWCSNAVP